LTKTSLNKISAELFSSNPSMSIIINSRARLPKIENSQLFLFNLKLKAMITDDYLLLFLIFIILMYINRRKSNKISEILIL